MSKVNNEDESSIPNRNAVMRPSRRQFITSSLAGAAALGISQNLPISQVTSSSKQVQHDAEALHMGMNQIEFGDWKRKHDDPAIPHRESVKKLYPTSLQELIAICTDEQFTSIRASGSHWALSEAAVSEDLFIETHDPENTMKAMSRTLHEVLPDCMNPIFLDTLGREHGEIFYPVHVEAGKRLYQLYSELDWIEELDWQLVGNQKMLAYYINEHYDNSEYMRSWALETMGNAAGQTVVGAISTGTHGGDHRIPPLADLVMAVHLVADGGKHYWIEPKNLSIPQHSGINYSLTDKAKLENLYGQFGEFEVIYDDDLFNAVLVSIGRFGIIYSVILRAVPQYALWEQRELTTWQEVYDDLRRNKTSSNFFNADFLQIAIQLTQYENFTKNRAAVTKRTRLPLGEPIGRKERRGELKEDLNPITQSPRFEFAGNSEPFKDNNGSPAQPTALDEACKSGDFVPFLVEELHDEVEDVVKTNGIIAGSIASIAVGGLQNPAVASVLTTLPGWLALLAIFKFLVDLLTTETATSIAAPTLGEVTENIRKTVLDPDKFNDPNTSDDDKNAMIIAWIEIAKGVFDEQQKDRVLEAISYAVTDAHNYLDEFCSTNIVSMEVFFDVNNPMLLEFINNLIIFENNQLQQQGKSFAGYVALRFTGKTRALIGMERWEKTCSVEIAGLTNVAGTLELVDYAIRLSRNRNYDGILHWGQQNEATIGDIEHWFGNDLLTWRQKLGDITDNGRLKKFSTNFTTHLGLEVI
jgi:hypothetical protein